MWYITLLCTCQNMNTFLSEHQCCFSTCSYYCVWYEHSSTSGDRKVSQCFMSRYRQRTTRSLKKWLVPQVVHCNRSENAWYSAVWSRTKLASAIFHNATDTDACPAISCQWREKFRWSVVCSMTRHGHETWDSWKKLKVKTSSWATIAVRAETTGLRIYAIPKKTTSK